MGGFDNWFYNTLAGINVDPDYPGFKHFFLQPHAIPGLGWVRCHHDCIHGRIESHWQFDGEIFSWQVKVPPGTTATATLPFTRETIELEPGDHRFSIVER